jgi:hypothetical protein
VDRLGVIPEPGRCDFHPHLIKSSTSATLVGWGCSGYLFAAKRIALFQVVPKSGVAGEIEQMDLKQSDLVKFCGSDRLYRHSLVRNFY